MRPPRVEIVVSGATVLKAAFVALAAYLVIVAHEVILTIGLAFVFAFGLDPMVTRLTRRGMGRGKAALLVFLLLFVIVSVLVIWAATPIWHEIRQVVGELPSYIEDLKDEPLFDQLHENTDVADKAESLAQDAAKKIPEAASALLGITGGLVGSVLSVVTLVFLTLFLLIGLSDFKRAALVLALIVGLFDLIPQVGSLIAAVIVVAITLAASGVVAAVVMAIVILVYQQIENYLIQPLVYRRAVELSGFATIAVVLAGGVLLRVIGAILAVPVAASLKVVVRELTSARRERMAALRT